MRTLPPDASVGPRRRLLDHVSAVPGAHLRGIERACSLPLGQVLYHLDRLERMGLIVSVRDQGFRRFYAAGNVGRSEKAVLAALRHEHPRRILLALLKRSPRSHKDMQEQLGVAGSTLSFHLQRLGAAGVIVREREGTANAYALAEPQVVARELVFYRGSFADAEVDAYVRELLDSLPLVAAPAPAPVVRAVVPS